MPAPYSYTDLDYYAYSNTSIINRAVLSTWARN